ncbi:MAG: T9SS type A sorting domain-containing protein [Paludibacter sp.]|nr:T9SS type A sorting domain-containing protein [Paludibacter sp.]
MKSIYVILISLFLSGSFMSYSANIVYPWRATTAIVKTGDSFEIWFNADANQTVSSVQLKSQFLTLSGTNMNITNGTWTFDPVSGNKYNQKIAITIPAGTPADRYDLLLNTSTGQVTSFGGVKVVKEFKTEYYVVHISDGHLYQGGYDSDVILQRKSLIVQMSNIMDTEILIETGDNMYNVRNHPEREVEYFLGKSSIGTIGMAKASAATFAVPGDHEGLNGNDFMQGTDQENSDFVNDYWGLQNHSFKYGSARYMMLNNAWGLSATNNKVYQYQVNEAIAWLNGAGAGGNFLLTAGHNYDRMFHFINNVHPLNLCLSGDRHSQGNGNPWEITPGGPRISYTCNDLRGGMKYIIYRVNNNTGTFTLPAGGTGLIEAKASGDVNIPSTWVPRLKQTFSAANNGTISTNSVTVENKFPFPILGGKVRFVVPKGSTYDVTNGVVSQEFDGTSVHVVDVSFNVEANSSTTVYIAVEATALNDIKSKKLEKDFSIYPNPYKQGNLYLNLNGFNEEISIKISNLLGQTIYQEKSINKSHVEFNLSGKLNDAIYFISVESEQSKITRKLVVQNR